MRPFPSTVSRAEAESLEKRYLQLKRKFQGKGKKLVAASLQQMACPPLTPALLSSACHLRVLGPTSRAVPPPPPPPPPPPSPPNRNLTSLTLPPS